MSMTVMRRILDKHVGLLKVGELQRHGDAGVNVGLLMIMTEYHSRVLAKTSRVVYQTNYPISAHDLTYEVTATPNWAFHLITAVNPYCLEDFEVFLDNLVGTESQMPASSCSVAWNFAFKLGVSRTETWNKLNKSATPLPLPTYGKSPVTLPFLEKLESTIVPEEPNVFSEELLPDEVERDTLQDSDDYGEW